MQLSISHLSELTGRDRRTITKALENIPFVEGGTNAHLYESAAALAAIYKGDDLTAAKTQQAFSQASLNRVKEQELKRTRIPIDVVLAVMNEIFGSIGAKIKNTKKTPLTNKEINEIFQQFRDAPDQLKW